MNILELKQCLIRILDRAEQNAKDELKNRIVVGMPVLQNASPDEDIKNLTEY